MIILNIKKYREMSDVVVPVWSSHDEEYYNPDDNKTLVEKVKENIDPARLIYSLTNVRLKVPITYLKREIPLLAYYTPEELKTPTSTIYEPGSTKNKIIQLKFNLNEQINEITDNGERNNTNNEPDKGNQSVDRRMDQQQPLVAIYHTHTSETYVDDPRIQDNNGHVMPGKIGNVAKVGMEMARVLSDRYNFKVIHTTRVHDETYSRSYFNSRQTIKKLVSENKNISLVFDIHRDGGKKNPVRDLITTVINEQRVAKVMIVVTSNRVSLDNGNLTEKEWQENMKMANLLAKKMNEMYPGLLMRIEKRDTTYNRYNQDLHPHSLILEIGDYRNTTGEAIKAARYMAEVIASLKGEL